MKVLTMVPVGATLFALSLGLSSVAPSVAGARDEDSGTKYGQSVIRAAQADRDNDSDTGSGYLGVQVQRLTAALRRAKGIPETTEGTLVNNVEDQSPADNGGVKRGDVILQVNHQPTADPSDLVQTVGNLEPGRRVSVLIWRDGVTRTLTLTVGSRPEGNDAPPPMPPRNPNWGGPGPGPGDPRDMPDNPRMQILRRNRDDLERQVRDLQDQVASLRREVQKLRSDFQQQMNRRDRNRDDDRKQSNDRDEDNNNEGD